MRRSGCRAQGPEARDETLRPPRFDCDRLSAIILGSIRIGSVSESSECGRQLNNRDEKPIGRLGDGKVPCQKFRVFKILKIFSTPYALI